MGAVYLARSPGGRLVAVKVVRDELAGDEGFRARFAREIEAARRVSGAFTAAVVDADPDADHPWLATEYLPGPTLQKAIDTVRSADARAVCASLAGGLAEALSAIHRSGLVHRDLKPSNIVLTDNGPRVIDFGIARALEDASLTATGVVIGTPGYLSPEQITGTTIGPPSDMFAAGRGAGVRGGRPRPVRDRQSGVAAASDRPRAAPHPAAARSVAGARTPLPGKDPPIARPPRAAADGGLAGEHRGHHSTGRDDVATAKPYPEPPVARAARHTRPSSTSRPCSIRRPCSTRSP